MDVKLSEGELKAAIKDWLEKQMPDLLKEGRAEIGGLTLGTYPANATVTVDFVMTMKTAAELPSETNKGE